MAIIKGTEFNDNNTPGRPALKGTPENDRIFGLAGNDVLIGLDGNDNLNGGTGNDFMQGGTGNDVYIFDSISDFAAESAPEGIDLVKSSVSVTMLNPNVENLTLTGNAAINGSGNGMDNLIRGNNAANTLSGLGGNDKIFGGGGDDLINGGDGNNTLNGGAGFDIFRIDRPIPIGIDTIKGFVVADDTIQVLQSGFRVGPPTQVLTNLPLGSLAADSFHLGASAGDKNDYFIYNPANGRLFFDQDGSGSSVQVRIAKLATGLAITNNDIVVV